MCVSQCVHLRTVHINSYCCLDFAAYFVCQHVSIHDKPYPIKQCRCSTTPGFTNPGMRGRELNNPVVMRAESQNRIGLVISPHSHAEGVGPWSQRMCDRLASSPPNSLGCVRPMCRIVRCRSEACFGSRRPVGSSQGRQQQRTISVDDQRGYLPSRAGVELETQGVGLSIQC